MPLQPRAGGVENPRVYVSGVKESETDREAPVRVRQRRGSNEWGDVADAGLGFPEIPSWEGEEKGGERRFLELP